MPMTSPQKWISRLVLAAAVGLPMVPARMTFAADDDGPNAKELKTDQVPAPVMATAKQWVLDSDKVVYRQRGADHYIVNFTTPDHLRLRMHLNVQGQLTQPVELHPDQPEKAPKGKQAREASLVAWGQRVEKERVAALPPPVTPAPVATPPTNAPMAGSALPPPVATAFDRLTAGGSELGYYQQVAGGVTRYMVQYTHKDTSRREVVVNPDGTIYSGPVVLREAVEDKDLDNDKAQQAGVPQPVDMARIQANEVPQKGRAALQNMVGKGTDVRYRKDTFSDKTLGYTVHWIAPAENRRYWATVRDDGSVMITPRLSIYQPGGKPIPGDPSAPAIPDAVRSKVSQHTQGGSDVKTVKATQGGKTVYRTTWTGADKKQHEIRMDEKGNVIGG